MKKNITIVTSIHPDFNTRIWKHATSVALQKDYSVFLICPWNVENNAMIEGVTLLTFAPVKNRVARIFKIPFRVLMQLKKVLSKSDIIHFHDLDLLPIMGLLALFGKKIVYDVHENYADEMLVRDWVPKLSRYPLYYLVLAVEKLFSLIIKNIVLVAPSQIKNFTSPKLNIIFIKNYASTRLSSKIEDNYLNREPSVIFIGTQHANNGALLYLEIIEKVIKIRQDIIFLASDRFSSQRFKEKYLELITAKNINNHLKLLPNVRPDEIHTVLNQATIAINPNLRVDQQINGIHTKIFEFMALGLPNISSDLPHQVEVISKCKSGILANPDKVDTFVDAIIELVDNRDKAKKFGENGRACFLEHFSWESQVPKLINYYEKIS